MSASDERPDTRERLIQAGIEIFAEHGFDAATTRMLTDSAGVNLSAIPYYFKSKEGLYREVIDRIAVNLAKQMTPVLERIDETCSSGEMTPARAITLIKELIADMVEVICEAPYAAWYNQIILREQMNPSGAYDIIYNKLMKRMLDSLVKLVSVSTGESKKRKTTLQAFSLFGQVLIFRTARESIVRYLGLDGYNAAELEELREIITTGVVNSLKLDEKEMNKNNGSV
jgi:AcrR family transcriptional regulator